MYRARILYAVKEDMASRIATRIDFTRTAYSIFRGRGVGRIRAAFAADDAACAFLREWMRRPMSEADLCELEDRVIAATLPRSA